VTANRGTRHNPKPWRPPVSLAGPRLQQRHGGFAVEAVAAQEKAQRAAFAVGHRVDFGCAAAAACAEGLVLAPFLPRAERWTLMAVLSIAFS
jgi:hypothetical protein